MPVSKIRSEELDLPPSSELNPLVFQMYEYWRQIKGDRLAPQRQDLLPNAIKNLLPFLTLFDYLPDKDRFRVRLAGTETIRFLQHDLTGRYVDEFQPIQYSEYLQNTLRSIRNEKKSDFSKVTQFEAETEIGAYCSLRLPLSDNGNDVSMIIAFVDFDDQGALVASRLWPYEPVI